jgi:hypothetical protein
MLPNLLGASHIWPSPFWFPHKISYAFILQRKLNASFVSTHPFQAQSVPILADNLNFPKIFKPRLASLIYIRMCIEEL